MRLDEGETITQQSTCSPSLEQFVATHPHAQLCHEATTAHLPPDGHSSQADYFPIVARATNDAVRDWNLKNNTLSWPQGLESLLRYDASVAEKSIEFWQKNIYPGDRARVEASIRDCLAGSDDRWSGEYRFRRCDGTFINVLDVTTGRPGYPFFGFIMSLDLAVSLAIRPTGCYRRARQSLEGDEPPS